MCAIPVSQKNLMWPQVNCLTLCFIGNIEIKQGQVYRGLSVVPRTDYILNNGRHLIGKDDFMTLWMRFKLGPPAQIFQDTGPVLASPGACPQSNNLVRCAPKSAVRPGLLTVTGWGGVWRERMPKQYLVIDHSNINISHTQISLQYF